MVKLWGDKVIYYCIFAPPFRDIEDLNKLLMKKFTTGLLFTVLSAGTLFAQPKGIGTNDPEAKKVLDAVSAKFKTFKTVQAKFSLAIENSSGQSLGTKTGTLYIKGSKYRISVTGQEIFCDGANVSTYEKSTNEVTITRIDPTVNTITPQKLFTNFYDKDFLYKLNGTQTVKGKAVQEIELTPIDKSKPFFKVLLYVDKASNTIKGAKLFEKTGNRFNYSVSGFTPNAAVNDAQFAFDAKNYPGVEVVDLR